MKTDATKIINLVVVTAVMIIGNSSAGTNAPVPCARTSSSDMVKVIQVGRKGIITVVHKKKTPSGASTASPKKMLSIANGYETVEI